MNFKNTDNPLKIVISVGDESGIGPEIILKALFSQETRHNIESSQFWWATKKYWLYISWFEKKSTKYI